MDLLVIVILFMVWFALTWLSFIFKASFFGVMSGFVCVLLALTLIISPVTQVSGYTSYKFIEGNETEETVTYTNTEISEAGEISTQFYLGMVFLGIALWQIIANSLLFLERTPKLI